MLSKYFHCNNNLNIPNKTAHAGIPFSLPQKKIYIFCCLLTIFCNLHLQLSVVEYKFNEIKNPNQNQSSLRQNYFCLVIRGLKYFKYDNLRNNLSCHFFFFMSNRFFLILKLTFIVWRL